MDIVEDGALTLRPATQTSQDVQMRDRSPSVLVPVRMLPTAMRVELAVGVDGLLFHVLLKISFGGAGRQPPATSSRNCTTTSF